MRFLRAVIGFVALTLFATTAARSASTTNYSDQWWIPAESGWGASVLQQGGTLFIDLFLYGSDNKPTWFVAPVYYQSNSPAGHDVFTGDLIATAGTYYGAPFNPAAVSGSKVGTLTFDANSGNTAMLSYTVNGVAVVKSVTRQTWGTENLSGSYYGGLVMDRTGCKNSADNGHDETPANFQITHLANNSVTIVAQFGPDSCTITGTYSQAGHMGQIPNGRGPCDDDGGGVSFNLYELERTISGFTGRISAVGDPGGGQCKTAMRIGGVRR